MSILDGSKGVVTAAAGADADFEYLTLSENHCMAHNEEYSFFKTADGVRIEHNMVSISYGSEPERSAALQKGIDGDKALYEKIKTALAKDCHILSWDGFHGSDPNVLDGTSFSFEMKLADGKVISAGGTNSFPNGYRELTALFNELLYPKN
ncbi:MAG: hypothetical protein IJ555_00150 [Ruminococcus sp.]|nr:hypothetical protein [Ruminococcus sp.]MBR1750044.1 hypothetical protein [Ruminococcus sp.]